MAISINNLSEAIYEASNGKTGAALDKISKSSLDFIIKHNMLAKTPQILAKLESIADQDQGIVRAKISSKDKLTAIARDEIKSFIKHRYKATEVLIEENTDPKLLGGIKIETGDEVIDTTLRKKLNKLENYLNNSQI